MEKIIARIGSAGYLGFNGFLLTDAPKHLQCSFQDPASFYMEAMIDLHHDIFGYLLFISVFVLYLILSSVYFFYYKQNRYEIVDIRYNMYLELA